MHTMRLPVLILLLLLPLSMAGSPGDPEITDGAGDVEVDTSGFVNIATPEIDIVSAWLTSNASNVSFHWRIVDVDHRTELAAGAVYAFTYRDDFASTGAVLAERKGERWTFTWFALPRDGGPLQSQMVQGSVVDDVVQVDVPGSLVNGTMTHLKAGSLRMVNQTGGGAGGGGHVWFRDAAPDDGYGRDFTPA